MAHKIVCRQAFLFLTIIQKCVQSSENKYTHILGQSMGSIDLSTADYLAQLLKDKKQLSAFPNVFIHVERLLDKEIGEVREKLFNIKNDCPELPEPMGNIVCVSEKIYIPVNQYPDFHYLSGNSASRHWFVRTNEMAIGHTSIFCYLYLKAQSPTIRQFNENKFNFVGRILGPRGMTAKQLETDTGCKIMVRGKGSMRDKVKEDHMKDKPNWEHLNDDLHVLVSCEDYESRAPIKLKAAVDQINRLLIPQPDGEDDLKKKQLIELAILNGTYRDNTFPQKFGLLPGANNRLPATIGAPLIITSPRMAHAAPVTSFFPAATLSHDQTQTPAYFYIPTPAPLDAFTAPAVIDYASLSIESSSGGPLKTTRNHIIRAHPYNRPALC